MTWVEKGNKEMVEQRKDIGVSQYISDWADFISGVYHAMPISNIANDTDRIFRIFGIINSVSVSGSRISTYEEVQRAMDEIELIMRPKTFAS